MKTCSCLHIKFLKPGKLNDTPTVNAITGKPIMAVEDNPIKDSSNAFMPPSYSTVSSYKLITKKHNLNFIIIIMCMRS